MLRLGIVGIGTIAKDYIGLIYNGAVSDVELTALCSRNYSNIQRVFTDYPNLNSATFTDYGEMLSSNKVDAVLICTPHGQHPSMADQAIQSGLHVLVEKPVGIHPEDVGKVIDSLNERPNLVCGVMYNRRMSKSYSYVKRLVEDNFLGELVRVTWLITNLYRTDAYYSSSPWRGTWEGEGGGLLMTQASHQLDLLQWICGMPLSVMARCSTINRNIEVENEAELLLNFPNGAHGQFIASAHEAPGTNRLEIIGTKGSITVTDDRFIEVIKLSDDEREFTKSCPNPFEKPSFSIQRLEFEDEDNKIQQAATIQNFIHAVAGKEQVSCTLESGLNSLLIIRAAYASSRSMKEVPL